MNITSKTKREAGAEDRAEEEREEISKYEAAKSDRAKGYVRTFTPSHADRFAPRPGDRRGR